MFNCDNYFSPDIDECKGHDMCHINATCENRVGSYECHCFSGFTGNGFDCTSKFCQTFFEHETLSVSVHVSCLQNYSLYRHR